KRGGASIGAVFSGQCRILEFKLKAEEPPCRRSRAAQLIQRRILRQCDAATSGICTQPQRQNRASLRLRNAFGSRDCPFSGSEGLPLVVDNFGSGHERAV